jgi:hypothetical protein
LISLKLLLILLIVVSCAAGVTLASIYFHSKFDLPVEGTISIENDRIMVSFDIPLSQLRKQKTILMEISDHMSDFPES